MQDPALNAERATPVLCLVAQHCNHLLALKDVCALLQTNSSVRRALQQLRVGYMVPLPFGPLPVKYGKTTVEDVQRSAAQRETWLASFTEWLPHHASLVGALKHDCSSWEPQQEQQLALLLRLCRLQTATEALPPLRLTSLYVCGVPASVSLLHELGCVKLQELNISQDGGWDARTPNMQSFCAALQRLASLRRLALIPSLDYEPPEQHALAADCVVAAVAQLSGLTALELGLVRREWVVRFPPSLQELEIDITLTACGCEVVDLSHLTALTKLVLGDEADTIPELVLPPQLTSLDAARALPARFTGASGLQLVSAVVSSATVPGGRGFLECLLSLPSLVELDLGLDLGSTQLLVALPSAASVLGRLTRLTALALRAVGSSYVASPVDVCGPVSQLTKLRSLELRDLPVCQEGILRLTALHSLTQLQLHHVGLDDVSIIALTMALTGLQHLQLAGEFNSRALMPAAAGLRALRHLCVSGVDYLGVCDRELLLLSGLTQLSHITLPGNNCTDGGKQRLLSHLRRLPAVLD